MRSCCAGRCGPHEHDSGTPVTTRRLLALNVGSSTLKGASYLFNTVGHCAQPRLLERSRAEMPFGVDAQERLATLLEPFSASGPGPVVVVHRIVLGGYLGWTRRLGGYRLNQTERLGSCAPFTPPVTLTFASSNSLV